MYWRSEYRVVRQVRRTTRQSVYSNRTLGGRGGDLPKYRKKDAFDKTVTPRQLLQNRMGGRV